MLRSFLCFSAALLAAFAMYAHASVAVVPDHYPTIQAAIDAHPDTVMIRAGDYHERPVVDLPVLLLGMEGEPRPRIDGLEIRPNLPPLVRAWHVRRCDFSGPVRFRDWDHGSNFSFIECAFDSGLFGNYGEDGAIDTVSVIDCRLGGPITSKASFLKMERDTLDAGISLLLDDGASILGCWFRGGAGSAVELEIGSSGSRIFVQDNRIENYDTGIDFGGDESLSVVENTFRSIRGRAIDVSGEHIDVLNNTITDCEIGIYANIDEGIVLGNSVLRASDTGYRVIGQENLCANNVAGHCGAAGILSISSNDTLRNNTSFNNGGSGFELIRAGPTVRNNISFGNAGWGLSAADPNVTLGCNDWFANALGATNGTAPDPSDLAVDPMFCDLDSSDVSLAAGSPLIDAAGCGLIGARGLGCATTPTLIQMLVAEPGDGMITVRWRFGAHDWPADVWVERAVSESGSWLRLPSNPEIEDTEYILRDEAPPGTHWYRIGWIREGRTEYAGPVSAHIVARPGVFLRVSPNPSFGIVVLDWSLPNARHVTARIYDLAGRDVASIVEQRFGPGVHRAEWDGRLRSGALAPAGWYVVKLRGPGINLTKRLLLVR